MKSGGHNVVGGAAGVVVAGVHDSGGERRVVILERGGDGARLVHHAAVPAAAGADVASQLRSHRASCVVRVAPAGETLCRTVTVPVAGDGGNDGQTHAALRLLAEAELPASVPAHRRAVGVVGAPELDGTRTGLLTAWIGEDSPGAFDPDVPERWTTLPGALAALWAGQGLLAAYADESQGAAVVIAPAPAKVVVRLARVAPGREFAGEAAGAIREACEAGGARVDVPGSVDGLVLDGAALAALRAAVQGLPGGDEWMNRYAIALGAALLAWGGPNADSGHAGMTALEPRQKLPAFVRFAEWMRPAPRPAIVVAACAGLLLALPIAMAWGRSEILRARVESIRQRSGGTEELQDRAAMYSQMYASRWPMAKLLNDLSTAAPVGVTIKNLRLSPGQGLTVHGVATSQSLVTDFQAALNATKVFGKASVSRREFKEGGVEFDLTADVVAPFVPLAVKDETDFVTKPLAVRLYGEGASNDAVDPHPPGRSRTRGARDTAGDRRPGGAPAGPITERRPSESEALPPVVSDDEIARMDRDTAMKGWTLRVKYVSTHPTLDAATKQRLQDEGLKMKERMQSLRGGG